MAAQLDLARLSLTRPIWSLSSIHRDALTRAIINICETEVAQTAYAQILDGVPTLPLIDGGEARWPLPKSHPSRTTHRQICDGVMDRLAEFRRDYVLEDLALQSEAMREYNSAAPGSRLFNTKLIELTARAIHQIAVDIIELDESWHKNDELGSWIPPKTDETFWRLSRNGPPPTWFHLHWYRDYQQYPNGSKDMIGYWVENRIFGGVVLFDRGTPGGSYDGQLTGEPDPHGVFLHSEYYRVTYRIYKLLDDQKKKLLDFLTADPDVALSICPLPLAADGANVERVDPEELISKTGVYRDRWERKDLPDDG